MKRGILFGAAALVVLLACSGEEDKYQLGEFIGAGYEPAWGNNGLIAFSTSSDINTCDEYGRNRRNITNNRRYDYVEYPAWSPDCEYIVYSQFREENMKLALYIIPGEGGEPRLLVEEGENPAWSPDGKWIAYVAPGGEIKNNLWIIRAEGGTPTRLTTEHYVRAPTWAPGGGWIIFTGNNKTSGNNLWAMKCESRQIKKLTPEYTNYNYGSPSMRAEGDWIAFSYYPKSGPSDIWAFNVKTKDFARVTRVWEEGSSGAWEPSWAPDGRTLVYNYGSGLYKTWLSF